MEHSFTRALTALKVDFMMIITGECSECGPRWIGSSGERKFVKEERGGECQVVVRWVPPRSLVFAVAYAYVRFQTHLLSQFVGGPSRKQRCFGRAQLDEPLSMDTRITNMGFRTGWAFGLASQEHYQNYELSDAVACCLRSLLPGQSRAKLELLL